MLVPLVVPDAGSAPEVLFLVRPQTMPTHAGQVAFPGGGAEAGEDAVAAALREAEEELGIPRSAPDVLGCLDDLRTHTGFVVTPVVARLPPDLALAPSPREVDAHFSVPLPALLDPRGIRTARGIRVGRVEVTLRFWVDAPHVIWGATGHILWTLLEILGRAPTPSERARADR
ncbi:MAG: CoA pyrophosphatase [Deltaproteobacteria bacterium]|nr:CoA pyrophosphatase [Deltaproteobacteria bacterium]